VPRLVDYAVRFDFIRRAAFAVVRDDGVDALSRRRVAAELGTSVNTIRRLVADWVDLVGLAADHVDRRRRLDRFHMKDPRGDVAVLIRRVMPESPSHLDEELVWLKLVAACGLVPSGLEPPGTVRRDFRIAEHGFDIDAVPDHGTEACPTPAPGVAPVDARREALHRYLDEREQALTKTVETVLDLLEVPTPRDDAASTLLAVIEGLTLSACRGRLTPERATDLAIAHAHSLGG
jgi:hypothetical protein